MITTKVLKKRISAAKKKQCIPVSKLKKAELIKAAVHYGVSTKKESKPFKVVRKKPAPFKAPTKKTTTIKSEPLNVSKSKAPVKEHLMRIYDFNDKMSKPIRWSDIKGKDMDETINNTTLYLGRLGKEHNEIVNSRPRGHKYGSEDGLAIINFNATNRKLKKKYESAIKLARKHFG